jgi:hypothetical protein
MKHRIWLNPDDINRLSSVEIKGRFVNVYLSPYDVPIAMSTDLDKARGYFRIEFEYSGGEEPTREQEVAKGIVFGIGRESDRLYRIEITLASIDPGGLVINFEQLVSDALGRLHPIRGGNYRAAKESIAQHRKELFAPLQWEHPSTQ